MSDTPPDAPSIALLARATIELWRAQRDLRIDPGATIARAIESGDRIGIEVRAEQLDYALHAARAIARVAPRLPGRPSCLPRAIALGRILERRNIPGRVRIGVRPAPAGGGVAAHAWVEVAQQPLGEPEAIADRFLPFVPN